MTGADALQQAISEATAAFDAGNHAWGRFLLYVLRPYHGRPPAPDPSPVRIALQEAALAVPHTADAADLRAFLDALLIAHREVEAFIAHLPPDLRTGDVLVAPDAFAEAIAVLAPLFGPEP